MKEQVPFRFISRVFQLDCALWLVRLRSIERGYDRTLEPLRVRDGERAEG